MTDDILLRSLHRLDVRLDTPARVIVTALDRGAVHVLVVDDPDDGDEPKLLALDEALEEKLRGAAPATPLRALFDPAQLVTRVMPTLRHEPRSRFATAGPDPARRPPLPELLEEAAPLTRGPLDLGGGGGRRPPVFLGGGGTREVDGGGTRGIGGGTRGTPVSALKSVQRSIYPHVHVLDARRVQADARVPLAVSLDAIAQAADEAGMDLRFAEGEATIDVHAMVSSPHFSRPSGQDWAQTFRVDRSLETDPGMWMFEARAIGERLTYELTVTFLSAGRVLGAVEAHIAHRDNVGSGPPERSYPGRLVLPEPGERSAARLRVDITKEGCESYLFRLFQDDEPWEDSGFTWSFNATEFFSELARANTTDDLLYLGEGLHVDLPAEVLAFLERPECEGLPTQFVSAGRIAPFELLRLRPRHNGPVLGIDRPVTRWTSREPMVGRHVATADRVACIRPVYDGSNAEPLPSAKEEEDWLKARYGDRMLEPARTRDEVLALLDDPRVGLIHFAGHANSSPARLVLEDGEFRAREFRASRRLMSEARPLMVLNGCKVGAGEGDRPSLSSNFAKLLLHNGCRALVAPLVSVRSTAARQAAELLHTALIEDKTTVAEAVRRVRKRALADDVSEADRGSLLSYLAFAPPNLGGPGHGGG